MAGEAPILVESFDNVGLANPNPYSVLDVDATNSNVQTTAAQLPAAALSESLGVIYDKAKVDTNGNVVKSSGFAVRMHGIARVIASGAVTPGQYVSVADTTGRVQAQAVGANGSLVPINSAQSPASVAANTTAEQNLAVTGLLATDVVIGVSKPTAQAGLGIVGWRVISAGHLGLTFANDTGSPITPTATETYTIVVARGATAGTAIGPVPVVGRALSQAQAAGDLVLVLLTPGVRV